jgi:hypothetical protein
MGMKIYISQGATFVRTQVSLHVGLATEDCVFHLFPVAMTDNIVYESFESTILGRNTL